MTPSASEPLIAAGKGLLNAIEMPKVRYFLTPIGMSVAMLNTLAPTGRSQVKRSVEN